ncbi:MAG: autotransporter outer membrane beta-barrel domain-containing protein [Lentilitoribacter sp.]
MYKSFEKIVLCFFVAIASVLFMSGIANAGSSVSTLSLTSSIVPQTNSAVSSSGTSVTINSDQLGSATDNAIVFDISATSASGHTVRGANVSTTAPKASSAAEITVTSVAQNVVKTFSIPVDQVAVGAANTVFTVTLEAFGSPDGDPLTTCSQANTLNISFPSNYECQITTLTVTVTPLTSAGADTGAIVNNFMRRRSGGILANEPDLHKQLDDENGGEINSVTYALSETSGGFNGSFNAQTNRKLASQFGHGYKADAGAEPSGFSNFWISGALSRTKQNGQSQDFGIVHLGAGYKINSDLLIGGIFQIDRASEDDTSVGASVSGTGWMIGPYLVARLQDNVLFDGRIAYGQSSNKVSPTGAYTDNFDTTRALVKARITGEYYHDDVKISPLLSFIYLTEKQKAYVDSLSATIPEQTVNLGQISFGSDVSKTFVLDNGMVMTPNAGIKGVWNFKDTGFLNAVTGSASTLNNAEISARLDFGVDIKNDNGMNFDIGGFFDGIGSSNYEAYGGSAKLTVNF